MQDKNTRRLALLMAALVIITLVVGICAPAVYAQGPEGVQGPQGVQGVQGPQGLPGVQGPPGLTPEDFETGVAWWGDSPDRGYTTRIRRENGGAKLVVAARGEIEIRSDGGLDIQAGAYVTIGTPILLTSTLTMQDAIITDTLTGGGDWYTTGTIGAEGVISTQAGIDIQTGNLVMPNDEYFGNTTDGQINVGIGASVEYSLTATGMYLQGNELVMDGDADSSLTMSTDDQLDINLAGTDEYTATATALYLQANELILDADADTSLHASTDDQIDVKINTADDFNFAANVFNVLSGSSIEVDTINEETAGNGVAVESVTMLDGGVSATNNITTTAAISVVGNISTAAAVVANTISEADAGNGVAVDSVLLKDGGADLTGDDLTFQNDETISNADDGILLLNATDVSISNFMVYGHQTGILIADDGWLTPTGTYQPIHAAGAIGFSNIYTGFTDGTLLKVLNEWTGSIVITDENFLSLAGDQTLGIGDNITLVLSGTTWIQTGASNN